MSEQEGVLGSFSNWEDLFNPLGSFILKAVLTSKGGRLSEIQLHSANLNVISVVLSQ